MLTSNGRRSISIGSPPTCSMLSAMSSSNGSSILRTKRHAPPSGATTMRGPCASTRPWTQRVMARSGSPTTWSLCTWVRNTAASSWGGVPASINRITVDRPASNCRAMSPHRTSVPAPAHSAVGVRNAGAGQDHFGRHQRSVARARVGNRRRVLAASESSNDPAVTELAQRRGEHLDDELGVNG